MLRYEKYFFHLMVLLALSIIVIPKYYITGDGASHTYNAKVLFDMVLGQERAFYQEFYTVNRAIDPNWMSHILIGGFLQFFPPWLADKLFQILYVLVFAYGFRALVRAANPNNAFLSLLFFPFVFNLPFQQGFYNYVLALGLMFWTTALYIRQRLESPTPFFQLKISVLLLTTAFAHGMPAVYAMLIIGFIWLLDHYQLLLNPVRDKMLQEISTLVLIFLPAAFFILLFMVKRGTGTEPHAWTYTQKLMAFFRGWTLQSTRHAEVYPAVGVGLTILGYTIWSLFHKDKVKMSGVGKVMLFMVGFTLFSYITCPHSIGGAGSIDIRLAFLPWVFMLIYLAGRNWNSASRMIFTGLSFAIATCFLILRFPYVMQADRVGQEIMKAANFIPDKSVVLNLHMNDWHSRAEGDSLFQKDGSFIHFSDFAGAYQNKHLIMLMNYEAEINYFPVNWLSGKNPRESISGMIPGNYPPCGEVKDYEKQIGRKIDFILLQNLNAYSLQDSCVQAMLSGFRKDFYTFYQSRNKAGILLKRR
ncbi:MAG: hypothetical protein JNJ58_09420 [Chitinophagaceae bacterium]|nr:hypothetical protein [Chitinophagaceae bacterium]